MLSLSPSHFTLTLPLLLLNFRSYPVRLSVSRIARVFSLSSILTEKGLISTPPRIYPYSAKSIDDKSNEAWSKLWQRLYRCHNKTRKGIDTVVATRNGISDTISEPFLSPRCAFTWIDEISSRGSERANCRWWNANNKTYPHNWLFQETAKRRVISSVFK